MIPTYAELRETYSVALCERIINGCWQLLSQNNWNMQLTNSEEAKKVIEFLRVWEANKEVHPHTLRRNGSCITCVYRDVEGR